MKINNTNAKSTQAATILAKELDKNSRAGKGAQADAGAALDGSVKVNMSPDAQAFQKAKAIASKDTVDEAKVARLQKLIDEGKYKVDAQAVADRLVDEQLLAVE